VCVKVSVCYVCI